MTRELDGGKGSAPRKQQDQDAYAKGWDAIFGKKPIPEVVEDKCPDCNVPWYKHDTVLCHKP